MIHSNLDNEIAPAVLIVDDDDIVLRCLQETVTAAGYRVRTAGSGVEALQSLESALCVHCRHRS